MLSRLLRPQEDEIDQFRWFLAKIAEGGKEYCGIPYPIKGEQMILEQRHPAAECYNKPTSTEEILENHSIRNVFYSTKERCDIVIYEENDKIEWGKIWAGHHIKMDFSTMGCSVAWSMESEVKALETLREKLPKHIFEMYFLTGMFIETSKRSGVTYIFRKLRPTVALRPNRKDDDMQILCCLCLHPIGYYAETWAGGMCPTDDVLAHLLLMRADEKMYWRRANQISAHRPNAGL